MAELTTGMTLTPLTAGIPPATHPVELAVIACGSRHYKSDRLLRSVMSGLRVEYGMMEVIHGAARGADTLVSRWAPTRNCVYEVPMPAKWKEHQDGWCPGAWCRAKSYCIAAGPERNQRMLDRLLGYQDVIPTLVIGFKDNLDATLLRGGTEDMFSRANDAGVECWNLSQVVKSGVGTSELTLFS